MTRTLLQAAAALVVAALAFVVDLPGWLRLVIVAAAAAALVFSLLGLVVRKPALAEGAATVRLDAAGDQPVAVIRELRRHLGLDLLTAKQAVDAAPADVATGVARPDAERVAAALRAAGAAVTVVEHALTGE